jgi:hypothetical protein
MTLRRRSFLASLIAGAMLFALPSEAAIREFIPAQISGPTKVADLTLRSADVVRYPEGTAFLCCHIEVDRPLPGGYAFTNCLIEASSDFYGEALFVVEGSSWIRMTGCVLRVGPSRHTRWGRVHYDTPCFDIRNHSTFSLCDTRTEPQTATSSEWLERKKLQRRPWF